MQTPIEREKKNCVSPLTIANLISVIDDYDPQTKRKHFSRASKMPIFSILECYLRIARGFFCLLSSFHKVISSMVEKLCKISIIRRKSLVVISTSTNHFLSKMKLKLVPLMTYSAQHGMPFSRTPVQGQSAIFSARHKVTLEITQTHGEEEKMENICSRALTQ